MFCQEDLFANEVNNQAAEVEGRARQTKPPQLAAEPVVPLRCSSGKAGSKDGVGDVSAGCLSGCLPACLAAGSEITITDNNNAMHV